MTTLSYFSLLSNRGLLSTAGCRPAILHLMPQPFQVGIKGIIVQDKKVLLLKFRYRDGNLHWDLPGGRIDAEEDIEAAFAREITEELPGLSNVRLERIVHAERAPNNFDNGDGLIWIFYLAAADINHLNDQSEHEGHEWINIDDIPALSERKDILWPAAFARALAKI